MSISMHRYSYVLLAGAISCVTMLSACDHDPVAPDDGPDIESGVLSVHTVASGRWLPEDGLQVWVEGDPETVQRVDLNGSTELRADGRNMVEVPLDEDMWASAVDWLHVGPP